MKLRRKLASGIMAAFVGVSLAMPMVASADEHDRGDRHEWGEHHDRGHHYGWRNHDRDDYGRGDRDDYGRGEGRRDWRWAWDGDHYRGYPYAYPYHRRVPTNGQGMINPRNPNLYWACDSDGHHCHWARR